MPDENHKIDPEKRKGRNIMKKLTLIFAALAVCASMMLTACSESGSNSGGGNGGSNNNIVNNDKDDKDDKNDKDDKDDKDDKVEYTHSTLDENGKFTSVFLGIAADFPTDTWIAYDDDDLADYNGGSNDEEDLKSILAGGGMIYEMLIGKETGSNVNIVIQNVGSLMGNISEEKYVDYNLEGMEEQLVSTGTMDEATASKKTVTFAGADHYAIDVEGTSYGIELYERIIVIKKGSYFGLITVTAMSEAERNEFTEMFYKA